MKNSIIIENLKTINKVILDFDRCEKTGSIKISVANLLENNNKYLIIVHEIKNTTLKKCVEIFNNEIEDLTKIKLQSIEQYYNYEAVENQFSILNENNFTSENIFKAFEYYYN